MKKLMFAALIVGCSEQAAPVAKVPGPRETLIQLIQLSGEGKNDEARKLVASKTLAEADRDGNSDSMLSMTSVIDASTIGQETITGDTAGVPVETAFGAGEARFVRENGAWKFEKIHVSMNLGQ